MFYSQRWSLFLVFSLLALPVTRADKANAQSLTVQNLDQPTQPTVVNSPSGARGSIGSVVEEADNPLQLTTDLLTTAQVNSWLSQGRIRQDLEQLEFSPSIWLNSDPLLSYTSSKNQPIESKAANEEKICQKSVASLSNFSAVEGSCEALEATLNLPVAILSESREFEQIDTKSKPQVRISQELPEEEWSSQPVTFIPSMLLESSIKAVPEPSISLLTWLGVSAAGLLHTSRKSRK